MKAQNKVEPLYMSAFPVGKAQKGLIALYALGVIVYCTAEEDYLGGWPGYISSRIVGGTLAAHLLEFVFLFLIFRSYLKGLPAGDSSASHFLPTLLYGAGHWMRYLKKKKK